MACNYVKDFDFGSASKAKGKPFARGGCATTALAKGGRVDPETREAVHKHERNMHPKEPLTPMKKGGKIVEKGTGEVYSSKAAMMRHEKGETKAEEMKEHAMKKGGAMHKMPDGSTMAGAKHNAKKAQKVVKGPAMAAGRDPRAALIPPPMMAKGGLYANIHAKRARIEEGSGEKMNKVGSKAAPSAMDFKDAAKTAKTPKK
jgi:hypothetical protein